MLLLHQVLPHVHHEHDAFGDEIAKIKVEDHSHGTDHHHHDEQEKEDDFDFLGFLLRYHSHSINVNNLSIVKNAVIQKIADKKVSFETILDIEIPLSLNDNEWKFSYAHSPPDFGKYVYLSSYQLRGPPVLG